MQLHSHEIRAKGFPTMNMQGRSLHVLITTLDKQSIESYTMWYSPENRSHYEEWRQLV